MTKVASGKTWREGLEQWCGIMPEFEHDPKKTALLIIDMQLCYAHRDYGLVRSVAVVHPAVADYYIARVEKIVVPNQVKLLEFFRSRGSRVIFVVTGSQVPDFSDLSPSRALKERKRREEIGIAGYPQIGDPEYSLLPELNYRQGELKINKISGGVFNSTGIDFTLRNMGIESLAITGVSTTGCVESGARDAADRGYKCILVEDACATWSEEAHIASLRTFARTYGNVKTTKEVIGLLSR